MLAEIAGDVVQGGFRAVVRAALNPGAGQIAGVVLYSHTERDDYWCACWGWQGFGAGV